MESIKLEAGIEIEVNSHLRVRVINCNILDIEGEVERGVILCHREDPLTPWVVWRFRKTKKSLDFYSGEYCKTLDEALRSYKLLVR